ncbi:MAG: DNA-binding protein, partial [Acidothermaceae bacterium]
LEDALTVKAAADRLGVSEGRVRQRITARSLLGIDFGGVWRLPAFQFTDDGQLRGFDRVLQAMPDDVHPIAVWRFIERANAELTVDDEPASPREWLATGGEIERVAELAESAYTLP